MMTLKQLVEEQKWNGMSDIQVIKTLKKIVRDVV